MASTFVSNHDPCGSRLQSLVCRGHCLISKVLKASNEIPQVFLSGYSIDEFAAYLNCGNTSGKNKDSSSFFGSSVLNIFGSGKSNNPNVLTKKIRCQAPSYRHSIDPHHVLDGSLDDDKFVPILVDFSYLSNPDKFDGLNEDEYNERKKIRNVKEGDEVKIMSQQRKSAAEQEQLEREFAFKYQSTLKKYYTIFEDIYIFYLDVNGFTSDLESGRFIQYNLKSLLLESDEARQLLCEILYLCGSLFILLDMYIPIRERLIIAHYRFCENTSGGNNKTSNFEELCKMFQRNEYHNSTTNDSKISGASVKAKHRDDEKSLQPQIQAELLSRISISHIVVKSIIECLVTVELYPNQSYAFPSYEHRSSKFGEQGAMLVVVLFFDPQILKQNSSIMRQVIDKFFYDTWVVPFYNGTVIDLSVEWGNRFPAAMGAIEHVVSATNIQRLNYENMKATISCNDEVKRYLVPKTLTTSYLLDHGASILDFLRLANFTLRWQILHRSSHLCPKPDRGNSAMIVDEHDTLSLILFVSQLEVQLVEAYHQLLENKMTIWSNCQSDAVEKMTRLSRYFYGNDSLKTVEKNEDVGRWFELMASEIKVLNFKTSGGEIQLCIEALDDVKRLDSIDCSLPSLDILLEARTNLVHMAKASSVKDDMCKIIDLVADFTYAREIIESLVPMLHSQSMRDPKSVTLLRAFFLKMGKPNTRLQQLVNRPNSNLVEVTEFLESAMLAFVKETLDVIPITIFSTLARIADEKSLAELPTKIEADRLSDYLYFKDRYNLAKITYELSVFTKGIFAMKKTLIGNLEIKPKGLLEEGLRKELVRQYSTALHNNLQFDIPTERSKQTLINHMTSCTEIFSALGNRVEGFQRSMIWLQDFLEIDGLGIFFYETSRVMRANLEREIINFSQRSAATNASHTHDGVPVPLFARSGSDVVAATFLGRTMNALIHLTDSKFTIYSNSSNGWFFSSGKQVCGMRTIASMRNAIGVYGLVGIEQLLCCKSSNELSRLFKFYSNIQDYGAVLEQFRDSVFPEWKNPKHGFDIYEFTLKKIMKLMVPLRKSFCRIGQLQLLRKIIWNDLRLATDSTISQSCEVANKLIMFNKTDQLGSKIHTDESIELFSDLIVSCGLADPIATVFFQTNALEGLPCLITLFVIHTMRELNYDPDFGALVGKQDESIDGWLVVAGIATVLKQYNVAYTKSVFGLLGQYVTCALSSYIEKARVEELPRVNKEVRNVLIFMRQLRSIAGLESTIIFEHIPQHLMEMIDLCNY